MKFQIVNRHGPEADRHLLRCLFSHVDFSGDGKSSGKDFHQVIFDQKSIFSIFLSSLCWFCWASYQKWSLDMFSLLCCLRRFDNLEAGSMLNRTVAISHRVLMLCSLNWKQLLPFHDWSVSFLSLTVVSYWFLTRLILYFTRFSSLSFIFLCVFFFSTCPRRSFWSRSVCRWYQSLTLSLLCVTPLTIPFTTRRYGAVSYILELRL